MRTSDQTAEIFAALAKVQLDIRDVQKDKLATAGGRGSYRYYTLPALLEEARRVLGKHGCGVIQSTDSGQLLTGEPVIVVATRIIHSSGQWVEGLCPVPCRGPGRKTRDGGREAGDVNAQTVGSAITYARRYGLSAMLGVAGTDDDDGMSARQRLALEEEPIRPIPREEEPVRPQLRDEEPPAILPLKPSRDTILTVESPWLRRGGVLMKTWVGQRVEDCEEWQSYVYHIAAKGRTAAQIREEHPRLGEWVILAARLRAERKARARKHIEERIQEILSSDLQESLLETIGAEWSSRPTEELAEALERFQDSQTPEHQRTGVTSDE